MGLLLQDKGCGGGDAERDECSIDFTDDRASILTSTFRQSPFDSEFILVLKCAVITYAVPYSWSKRSNNKSSDIAEMAAKYRTCQIRRSCVSFREKFREKHGSAFVNHMLPKTRIFGLIPVADALDLVSVILT